MLKIVKLEICGDIVREPNAKAYCQKIQLITEKDQRIELRLKTTLKRDMQHKINNIQLDRYFFDEENNTLYYQLKKNINI